MLELILKGTPLIKSVNGFQPLVKGAGSNIFYGNTGICPFDMMCVRWKEKICDFFLPPHTHHVKWD